MPNDLIPCGGCGAESPNDRCIGCMHNFGDAADLKDDLRTASVLCERLSLENVKLRGRLFMLTSELDKSLVETVERVADENQQLRELAREWCEAFETSNVKAVPDLIHRTKELG